jgi:predicted transcriptional regulator of viral defense system
MSEQPASEKAVTLFREHGGTLRTSEALRLGIDSHTLYALRDAGILEQLAQGLYRLADLPPLSNPDLVIVAHKIPRGVICLVSALAYHELTTQIPHAVDLALESGSRRPQLTFPPLRVFWFSGPAWSEGVEVRQVDSTSVRIYSPEKSVADAFKFRRRLGLDLAIEALQAYRGRPDFDVDRLLHYVRICRVEQVISPYLEAPLYLQTSPPLSTKGC